MDDSVTWCGEDDGEKSEGDDKASDDDGDWR